MPTTRRPLSRSPRTRISGEAVAAFRRMQAVDHDTRDSDWWDAHRDLYRALKLPPWEWPCVLVPDEPCPYPPGSHAEKSWRVSRAQRPQAFQLFADLTEAAREG